MHNVRQLRSGDDNRLIETLRVHNGPKSYQPISMLEFVFSLGGILVICSGEFVFTVDGSGNLIELSDRQEFLFDGKIFTLLR